VIRTHALITDILSLEQKRELAKSGDIDTFIQRLSETPYGRIDVDKSGDPSMSLEKAFYSKFIERMTKIVDIVPEKVKEFLQSYYYLRFETLNLKRILRGKFSGMQVSEIVNYLLPIEPYHVRDYKDLAEVETIEETVKLLRGTPYVDVEASLELSKEYDALWPLEVILNHIYTRTVLESLNRLPRSDRLLVRNIIEFELTVEDFLTAVKHRRISKEEITEERLRRLFPMTDSIKMGQIKSIIEAESLREAIEAIGSPYSEILSPIYEGDVALIRVRMREQIYKIVKKARSLNDFGFNVVMAYLVFSEVEKDDLVGIAWGVTQGIAAEEIIKYLATK